MQKLVLFGLLGLVLLGTPAAIGADQDAPPEQAPAEPQSRVPMEALLLFVEVFVQISDAYVHEIEDRVLLENAIRGMLSGLDPHSAYLHREEPAGLPYEGNQDYGGLGLEVRKEEAGIRVVSVTEDEPAALAGMEPGDLIIALDGRPTRDLPLADAVNIMRGPPGTRIKLKLASENAARGAELTLLREIIQVESVRREMLEPGYGYLRIKHFQERTGAEVDAAVRELLAGRDLRGLVLDLRDNPGGIFSSAVEVSDVFLPDGLITYTGGRLPELNLRFFASSPDATDGLPLVVLVNGGTASAAEVVAGALQDRDRAVILGTTTFGKGSVQTVLPLNEKRALKLTTSLYYTPSGRSIQAEGITPDIRVGGSRVTQPENRRPQVQERDLHRHLQPEDAPPEAAGRDPAQRSALVDNDHQLREALTLLKGFNILNRSLRD